MNFIKILLTILFSLGGYTEAAATLKKQVARCIPHQSHVTNFLNYKSNPSISASKPHLHSILSERRTSNYIIDAANQNKPSKYRTGSKRYKNRTPRIYRKDPMLKWLMLAKQRATVDARTASYLFFPEHFFIQRHKDLYVVAPRA